MPAHHDTLTATWTINSYTVTYVNGGGTGTAPTQADTNYNATFSAAAGTALTKSGYTFAGWNDSTSTYQSGDTYTMPAHNETLTATLTINSYTVTYVNGGGTGTAPTQADTNYNATFSAAAGTALTKSGYTFAGWN